MGIKKYFMGHSTKNLKNVSRYRENNDILTRSEEPYIALNIPGKGSRKRVNALLAYEGIEEINIPGSFLNVVTDITGLPVTHIIEVLGISKSTYYRVKDENQLEKDTVDKLATILKIYNNGIEAFGGREDFNDWLYTKIPTLGDKKPIDLLKTENGRSAVLNAINRIEYGIYG